MTFQKGCEPEMDMANSSESELMTARPTNASVLGARYDDALVIARAVARECGYALGRHGSELRDLDLIAAPWTEGATTAEVLALRIRDAVHGAFTAGDPKERPHGRLGWAIALSHPSALGDAMAAMKEHAHPYIDLSVMPRSPEASRGAE